MRVLVNTDTLEPLGGVERSTLQVSAALAGRGHSCHLLYARGGGGLEQAWCSVASTMTRVPGFTVAAARPWRTAHHLPASVRAARAARPDVIWANRAEQMIWAVGAARASGAALVVHLRHHPFPPPLVRLLSGRAARYLAVSAFLRDEWVAAGLDPRRVDVVPNGIDPDLYRPATSADRAAARRALGVVDDRPLVLSYGRLSAEKGACTLLQAWAGAGWAAGEAHLVLAGDATPDVLDLVRDVGDPSVSLLPRRDDVLPLLHAADLVVLPAVWQEPFGRVVIEAMAAGVPVVASRVGGIPEVLTGRFAAQLVPPGDVAALASVLRRHARWRVADPELGGAGRAHVERAFDLRSTVDGVEVALTSAVAAAPGRRSSWAAA